MKEPIEINMTKFYIGENLIEIWEDTQTIRTTFPDGTQLVAAPSNDDPNQLKTMKELGYPDLWTMCKSHEILHTAIAVGKGYKYSRGLYRAAKGIGADNKDFQEENEVLITQRLGNGLHKS